MKTMPRLVFFLLVFLLLWPAVLEAQREKDNWYMGVGQAITFPGGGPPTALTTGTSRLSFTPASATVSDKTTGQLLFYTNGVVVWNSSHQVMDNGTSISSSNFCTHVVTCPNPADANQYYIFTYNAGQLKYALVDMSENGGMGKVLTADNLLSASTGNKFTIARHGKDDSYWLITFRGSNGNDTFENYPINIGGIQAPVRSVMGVHNGIKLLGDLITNPAGDKIVITFNSPTSPAVNVYSFNKNCGGVNLPDALPINSSWKSAMGAAFSPGGNNLYVVYNDNLSYIVQYSGPGFTSAGEITNTSTDFYDVEPGPDGRLYISTGDQGVPSNVLDVIQSPDLDIFSVSYSKGWFAMSGPIGNILLPAFSADISKPGSNPIIPIIDTKNFCIHDTTIISPRNMPILDSLDWNFGDTASGKNNISKSDNTAHIYTDTGEYTITLSWYTCGVKTSTSVKVAIINPPVVALGPDSTLCPGEIYTLRTDITNADLTWSDNSKDTVLKVGKSGTYWLTASVGPRCIDTDSVQVTFRPVYTINFFDGDYELCEYTGETVLIEAGTGYKRYDWLPTGDTGRLYTAKTTGKHILTVTDKFGCTAKDSLEIYSQCDQTFYLPNAFTPNGDKLNEIFLPTYTEIAEYQMEIFTPWGQRVFESNNPDVGWDGTFKGEDLPPGAYIWKVRYNGHFNKLVRVYYLKGVVNLVR